MKGIGSDCEEKKSWVYDLALLFIFLLSIPLFLLLLLIELIVSLIGKAKG